MTAKPTPPEEETTTTVGYGGIFTKRIPAGESGTFWLVKVPHPDDVPAVPEREEAT